MSKYPAIHPSRRAGTEPLVFDRKPVGATLYDFWRWSDSDLLDNTLRGALAEFIVAQAIGDASAVRQSWASWDLTTSEGTKVEVKSAAYIQSWSQDKPSVISFGVAKRLGLVGDSGAYDTEKVRHADVYVFALLAHMDQATIDPLNLDQWLFYVLPTSALDERQRSQHSITLPSLERLTRPLKWGELRKAVADARRQPT